ncbi:MAG: hypothetical protein AAF515_02535 [Pseudomonadota bacterium]
MPSPKTICICGSMTFIDRMESLAAELQAAGYRVHTPVREEASLNWDALDDEQKQARKRAYVSGYLQTIRRSDLVLLANYEKHGIAGYIGPNSLMEAAFAYALDVPLAYLEPVGEQPCQLEALAMSSRVFGRDLNGLASVFG